MMSMRQKQIQENWVVNYESKNLTPPSISLG